MVVQNAEFYNSKKIAVKLIEKHKITLVKFVFLL